MAFFSNDNHKDMEYSDKTGGSSSSTEEPIGIASDGSLLHPSKPKGTVFNRRTVMVIGTAFGLIILLGVLYAFAPAQPQSSAVDATSTLQGVQQPPGAYIATPDELNKIPSSYKENLSPDQSMTSNALQPAYDVPPYNPSIPLSPPQLQPQQQTELVPLQPVANAAPQESEEQKEMTAVRKSPIRFGNTSAAEDASKQNPKQSTYTNSLQVIDNWDNSLKETIGTVMGGLKETPTKPVPVSDDQNQQDEKRQFRNQNQGNSFYATSGIQAPVSKFELKAGTIIPVTLITGINSDLPGNITAQVRENVYDTVSGKYLLIPQGAKVIGTYDSKVAYAQNRVLVGWSRLIFPNGYSLDLQNLSGVDGGGYSGLHDKVNNHYGKLFTGVLLTSILSAGAKVATGSNNPNPTYGSLAGQGVAENVANVGTKLAEKNINIQPTLEIQPGFKFNLFVDKDFILRPYVERPR